MKRHVIPAIAAACVAFWPSQSIAAEPPKVVVLVPHAEVTSKSTQVQRFNVNLPVGRDQVSMPLTLRLVNGGDAGAQKFVWVRMFLNPGMSPSSQVSPTPSGRMVVDQRSFTRSNELVLDLTGQLSAGNNLLMIQGAGMPGAALGYELKSQEVKGIHISSVDPTDIPPGGNLTINGSGFDEETSKNKVTIDNRACMVLSATANKIEVKAPAGLPPHAYAVALTSNGVKGNEVSVNVTGPPELGSTTVASMRPGTTFEFPGKHFSKNPAKNIVKITVSGMAAKTATVTSCTENSITINVPDFNDLNMNQTNTNADLSVEVDGVPATGGPMWVSIGYRMMAR